MFPIPFLSRAKSPSETPPFPFNDFVRRELQNKVSKDRLRLYAHGLAVALLHRSASFLLEVKADDVIRYKDGNQNTVFYKIMREAQKISEIIYYDLLFGGSDDLHRLQIARFYLKTFEYILKQHDYHTAMVIHVTLSSIDIMRIPYFKEELKPLKAFDELFDPSAGFLNLCNQLQILREEREKKGKACQAIPYFGIYTQKNIRIKAVPNKKEEIISEEMRKIFAEIEDYKSLISFDSHPLLYRDFLARSAADNPDENYKKSKALQAEDEERLRREVKLFYLFIMQAMELLHAYHLKKTLFLWLGKKVNHVSFKALSFYGKN